MKRRLLPSLLLALALALTACACAGGGRAGCSAKNLYGAVHLNRDVTRSVEE